MIGYDEFRRGMRRLAAGVSIISTQSTAGPLGITATAVTSLTPDPPSVLCCVNKNLVAGNAIRQNRSFCLNLLRQQHHSLARRFAGMDGVSGTAKFDEGAWVTLASGTPALADSLVSFDCQLDRVVEAGTHHVLIGVIHEIRLGELGNPLVYCGGNFTSLLPH
ncbi:flavin reductase family protein [Mycobacterium spongiae]|uniref:Flavin reductase n=1 Tax=Mycobacterium spongiae TaxID=886343 RepID=A0A975PYI0_9MYCO|nr:flavin reductase family protein [Mycobacterium spongiae]QUR69162.1 flavin reductase [Mycobacterium spongiae]